jgi:hypothetical protein
MTTFVVAKLAEYEQSEIKSALDRAGRTCEFFDAAEAATLRMETGDTPWGVIVQPDLHNADTLVSWIRGQGRLFSVPVIAMVDNPSDHAFGRAHAMGADDVIVRGDYGGITRRFANLANLDLSVRPPVTQGSALVVHPGGEQRMLLGRILRHAGFDIRFEDGSAPLSPDVDSGEIPSLCVVQEDARPEKIAGEIHALRQNSQENRVPMILLGKNEGTLEVRARTIGDAAVGNEGAPPDHLLFLANELLRSDLTNLRASARMLHGSLCAFRPAGELHPVYGLTYNVSREGLFVRTLDAPPPGTSIWFEMRPYGGQQAVHLRGEVSWRCGLHSAGGAAPPGFGMKILAAFCPPGDLADYHDAYEELRARQNIFAGASSPTVR